METVRHAVLKPTSHYENRLVSVNEARAITSYTYDGDGPRLSAKPSTSFNPTTFVWDGDDYLGEC